MRTLIAGLVTMVALAAAGCSSTEDATGASVDAAASSAPVTTPSTPSTPSAAGTVQPEAEPAQVTVDAYYTALSQRDCFTMRTLSSLATQQDDAYWADGCIDELQATVGDDRSYTVLDGILDGQEAVFRVQRPLPDGTPLTEEVVLIAVSGTWQVESRTDVSGASD